MKFRFLFTVRCALAFVAMLLPSVSLFADAVNTQAVVTAANNFMALLTAAQKTAIDSTSSPVNASCQYNFLLSNAETWSNIPISTSLSGATRNGLIYSSLTAAQKTAAEAVATAALGTLGKSLRDNIRASDRYISGEVTNAKGTTSAAWPQGQRPESRKPRPTEAWVSKKESAKP